MADISTTSSLTAEQHKKAVEAEYGQYVATEPIHIDGVLAFAKGHPVPAGHVKNLKLDKFVKSTKAEPAKDAKSS
jgi:hypothetical protein